MSARLLFTAALSAVVLGAATAAQPDPDLWAGKVKWADGYPKPYLATDDAPGGVELVGTFETPDGWEAKAVQVDYFPKAGGELKSAKAVKLVGGKWGAVDAATKKVVPARITLAAGEWTVRVLVTYQRTVNAAVETVPVQTAFVHVEVK